MYLLDRPNDPKADSSRCVAGPRVDLRDERRLGVIHGAHIMSPRAER